MAESLTQLLAAVTDGDRSAVDRLLPMVYDELRALAQSLLAHERRDHTLQATALVHEAYLKLINQGEARSQDRAHFFGVAALAMRRILVDHARTRAREKRDRRRKVSLDTRLLIADREVDLLSLHEALNRLAVVNEKAARIVEVRCFGGLTIEETATVLRMSTTSVERGWRYARAWLYRALAGETTPTGDGDDERA